MIPTIPIRRTIIWTWLVLALQLLNLSAWSQCSFTVNTTVTNVSCFNGTNGSVTIAASGGIAPYQYQLAEGGAGAWQSATNIYAGLGAGIYPVSVKDGSGCIKTSYITVTQPTELKISYTATDATCLGANNGTITSTVSGGMLPYSYLWTSNGGTYSTQPNLTALSPGNYQLVVTDANGCTKTPVILSQAKPIQVTGFNADGIANGTNISASASTTASMDANNGAVLFSKGYSTASGSTYTGGVPENGTFKSAQDTNRSFQLAAYTGNNDLLIRSSSDNAGGGATSGTLSFQAAYRAQYSVLYVLGTTGSGTGTVNYTVNFSDASTATGSITFPDWYYTGTTNVALGNLSRISRSTGNFETNNPRFNIFELPITLTVANQSKLINSVSFSWAGAGAARINIFGISGYNSDLNGIRINDGTNITVTPAVTVTSSAVSNTFCSGQSVSFTANALNGGNTPSYQWKINGVNVGNNSPTFSSATLSNNDIVTVMVTSSLACVSPVSVTSSPVTMTSGTVPASVSIAGNNSTCSGSLTAFVATPVNGGSAPFYQWKLNGNNVGINAPTYSSAGLSSGDKISVTMTSNIACATPNPSVSNVINMTVTSVATPSINIVSSPLTPKPGSPATFTATSAFSGSSPQYQWFKNGTAIAGATGTTLTVASAVAEDIYSVRLTSNYQCAIVPVAMSNYITVQHLLLPVMLNWFRVSATGSLVSGGWKTINEDNVVRFDILRAQSNTNNYSLVYSTPVTNSVNGSDYLFKDILPDGGSYTYKLVEIDRDHKPIVLGMKVISWEGVVIDRIANQGSTWKVTVNEIADYQLLDLQGRLIKHGIINVTSLIHKPSTTGVYLLRINNNKGTRTYKLK